VLFEFDKVLIQAREVLFTFDQKLTDSFLIFRTDVVHDPLLASLRRRSLNAVFVRLLRRCLSDAVLSAHGAETFKSARQKRALRGLARRRRAWFRGTEIRAFGPGLHFECAELRTV
jgi:hypothetical protein